MRKSFLVTALMAAVVITACAKHEEPTTVLPAVKAGAIKGEPDYSAWTGLLKKYYDPAKGMNYGGLKAADSKKLNDLREKLASVDVDSLDKKEQEAFWINYYNMNVVGKIVEHYPVGSIKDLSTDLVKKLNVFDQKDVRFGKDVISLNDIENSRIREAFHDPRIHFAINCAAKSCPSIRPEAYTGGELDRQLDDQVKTFLNAGNGAHVKDGKVYVTKVMDFFKDDFDKWGGGRVAFLKKYLSPDKAAALTDDASLGFDNYDWDLNDWKG